MTDQFAYEAGEEYNIEVPTVDRWLNHGRRSVRAFVRTPSNGINSETGVMVFLHGIGGRQNDISWKVMRRAAADRYNVIAVGVNFMGTDLFEPDKEFIDAQFLSFMPRIHQWPEHWPEKDENGRRQIRLDPEQFYYFSNKAAALQAGLAIPETIWDWGYFQALDVLNVLNAVRLQVELKMVNWGRCHMLSASAGGQVAHLLAKLAPQTFCSLLDLGGVVYVEEMRKHLKFALQDPQCRAVDNDAFGGRDGVLINNEFELVASRRISTGRFELNLCNGKYLDDEVDIRTITGVLDCEKPDKRLERLLCLHGRLDNVVDVPLKRRIAEAYGKAGTRASLVVVGEDVEVDGQLFNREDHSFYKNIRGIMERFGDGLFTPDVRRATTCDLGSTHTYSFPSSHGTWRMDFNSGIRASFLRQPE